MSHVHCRQKVVLLRAGCRVERRPRRKHARDLAPHNFFGELGILHLVAEGDPVALPQQPRKIPLDGVVRHPAHGNAALPVARGQRKLKLAAGHRRIVIKEFVKIAHPEEQQRVRILPLGLGPLAHKGRQLVGILIFAHGQGSESKIAFRRFIPGRCRAFQQNRLARHASRMQRQFGGYGLVVLYGHAAIKSIAAEVQFGPR